VKARSGKRAGRPPGPSNIAQRYADRARAIADGAPQADAVAPLIEGHSDLLLGAWAQVRGRLGGEANPLLGYVGRELDFIHEVIRMRTWAGQRHIVNSLLEHRRVSIRGSRKTSKTHTAAAVVLSFMQTAPTICLTTAPSNVQVKTLLWGKVNSMFTGSIIPMRGKIGQKNLWIGPEHYAIGFATNTSDRMQGFHAGVEVPANPDADPESDPAEQEELDPERAIGEIVIAQKRKSNATRLLFVIDEAAGVPQFIFDALRGSMLGDNVFTLMQANPTISINEPHDFARSHLPGSRYHRVKLAAKEATDPVDCDASFITPSWLVDWRELEAEYPEDDPLHKPMVLGQFLEGDTSGRVLTYALLSEAAASTDDTLLIPRGPHIGFDTAWTGADLNVAALWVDSVKVSEAEWRSQDTIATWEKLRVLRDHWAVQIGREIPWHNVHIDNAPVAAGVIDTAARAGCMLDRVGFGDSPSNAWRDLVGDVRFKNRRAEMYWVLRELIRRKAARLPKKWSRSWEELTATTYSIAPGTMDVLIEPKDKIRERMGRSPDHADADVLAFCQPVKFRAFRAKGL
jgi:hypothetical protein